MRYRKLLAASSVGALAVVGGLAATPGNGEGQGPPDDARSEQGCQGINEAQERLGEDNPAVEVLEDVASLLSDDDCESHDRASDRSGRNGDDE